jgi:hypothetical protein
VPIEEPVVPVEPVHRLRSVSPMTVDDRTNVRRLEFVPVGEVAEPAPRRRASKASRGPKPPAVVPSPPPAPASAEPRWSLWGDLET